MNKDTIINDKYKIILKICLEKMISLDTVINLIAMRSTELAEQVIDNLLEKKDMLSEEIIKEELQKTTSKIINTRKAQRNN